MNAGVPRPTALALCILALSSCSDGATEPETPAPLKEAEAGVAATSNVWSTRANMPSDRWGLTSAVVPNASGQSILYAIGGSSASFPQPSGPTTGALTKVQAYNAATNSWTIRASLPLPLYKTNGAGVIGGKIYVSGGRMSGDKKYVNALFVYDPTRNTWTRKRDMVTGTWGGVTGVINGRLYVLTCEEAEDCGEFSRMSLYRYDPGTDQWTFLSVTPVELGLPMGGTIGGKLYVTGGPRGALLAYDPGTNSWSSKASLPGRRWSGAGVAYHGQLYILGGIEQASDGSRRTVRKTTVYDPTTNTWTNKAQMPSPRFDLTASLVQVEGRARIEAVGGQRPGNNMQYVR